MEFTDFIPHGMILAFGGIVSYVYREHVKQDENRFGAVKTELDNIVTTLAGQNTLMNAQHSEVLKLLIDAGNQRELVASRKVKRGKVKT